MKECSHCGRVKPLAEFLFMRTRGTYRAECRPCMNASRTTKERVPRPWTTAVRLLITSHPEEFQDLYAAVISGQPPPPSSPKAGMACLICGESFATHPMKSCARAMASR